MEKAKYTLTNWSVVKTCRGQFVRGRVVETNRPSTMPVGSNIQSAKVCSMVGNSVFTEHAIYTLK